MTDTETAAPEAAPETPREPCLCGCGETPKGKKARFIPGHDAQLKASFYRTIRSTDEAVTAEAKAEAVQRLDDLGWPQPTPKAPRKPRAKAADKGAKNGDEAPADGEPVSDADL